MHDHTFSLSAQAIVDLGIAALYVVFAIRAALAWRSDRAEGYDSLSGRFLVALSAVFGACGLSGYALHAVAIASPEHAELALEIRLYSSSFLLFSTATLVYLELRFGLLRRINRAEGERDAAAERADGAEGRTLDIEEMWWQTGLPLVLIRLPLVEGVFRRVSESFAQAIGTTPEAMHGRSFLDFLTPKSRAESIDAARRSDGGETEALRGFRNEYLHQGTGEATHWEWIPVERDGSLWLGRDVTADVKRAREAEAKAALADEDRHAANLRALNAAAPLVDRAKNL